MTSKAREDLLRRLADVDELILAHEKITGGGKGRPVERQGAAITRSGIVMLSAAMEAFFEDIFEEAAIKIYPGMSADRRRALFRATSEKLNSPSVDNLNHLFLNIGIGWLLDDISWKKFANTSVIDAMSRLVAARNKIAHGNTETFRLSNLRGWRNTVERLSEKVESKVADRIAAVVGQGPGW